MNKLKALARNWLPPAIAQWGRELKGGGSRFVGAYATWQEATSRCTGYGADAIFERVRAGALKVKRGEALFERDGVCYHEETYCWEVLSCLLLGAAERGGRLNVLDFGGALGGFYFQHRKFFRRLPEHQWGVVEQSHYVDCGRTEFADDNLGFYSAIAACKQDISPNIVLLSSVLQYVETPFRHLAELGGEEVDYIIVDRTPFEDGDADRLVVQRVSREIFPATLPMWIFSRKKFDGAMNALGYSRVLQFCNAEKVSATIGFHGALYRRERK